MAELKEVFEMVTKQAEPDLGSWKDQEHRQRKASRKRRAGGFAVAAAIVVVTLVVAVTTRDGDPGAKPVDDPTSVPSAVPDVEVDSIVDLASGEVMPLPASIIGTSDEASNYALGGIYGAELAYSARDADGRRQIFVANLDGSGVRQATHDSDAIMPDWSPDGTMIAYSGYGTLDGTDRNIFVLDLVTEEVTQITFETYPTEPVGADFSPDGETIVFDMQRGSQWGVWNVPVTGGPTTLLLGARLAGEAGDGRLSPDGKKLVFGYSEVSQADGTDIGLSDAAGSDMRILVAGDGQFLVAPRWSPDAARIVFFNDTTKEVFVANVPTGETRLVAQGTVATWLDNHSLIVEPVWGP
jgi:dipeptidyl aminopeptidase/acylaminoacyl peptidase